MLRNKQMRQEQSCGTIFINFVSQLTPMKMLIYYLLLSSTFVKADQSENAKNQDEIIVHYPSTYYLHRRLRGDESKEITVSNSARVVVTDPACKISIDKKPYHIKEEIVKLKYTCSDEDIIKLTPPEEQVSRNVYEGQEYKNGALFYKQVGTPGNRYADGSQWDTLHKISFYDPDGTIIESGLIRKKI